MASEQAERQHPVQILPMNFRDEFPDYDSLEDVQKRYFLNQLPFSQNGRFQYRTSGLSAAFDKVVLFQCDNRIIASATLIGRHKLEEPDAEGYRRYLQFDVSSIKVFTPVTLSETQKIWPKVKSFSQVKWNLSSAEYSKFEGLIKNTKSVSIEKSQSKKPNVVSNLNLDTNLTLDKFKKYLREIGKSSKTAKNYSGAISGVMSNWAVQHGWVRESLFEISTLRSFDMVAKNIQTLDIFNDRNTIGKGMYKASLNAYTDFLTDLDDTQIGNDISDIILDGNIGETEKTTLTNARIGQGQFRKNLIKYWNGCAVTGYKNNRLLIASHIKPWRFSENQERLDLYNGLLLLPNLDKVFDKGYISFDMKGKIRISANLEDPEVVGVQSDMSIKLSKSHQLYMEYHRNLVFKDKLT